MLQRSGHGTAQGIVADGHPMIAPERPTDRTREATHCERPIVSACYRISSFVRSRNSREVKARGYASRRCAVKANKLDDWVGVRLLTATTNEHRSWLVIVYAIVPQFPPALRTNERPTFDKALLGFLPATAIMMDNRLLRQVRTSTRTAGLDHVQSRGVAATTLMGSSAVLTSKQIQSHKKLKALTV